MEVPFLLSLTDRTWFTFRRASGADHESPGRRMESHGQRGRAAAGQPRVQRNGLCQHEMVPSSFSPFELKRQRACCQIGDPALFSLFVLTCPKLHYKLDKHAQPTSNQLSLNPLASVRKFGSSSLYQNFCPPCPPCLLLLLRPIFPLLLTPKEKLLRHPSPQN